MNCKQGSEYIINQMLELLETLEDENYRQPLSLFKGSTIGQHFRHISDFYTCLIKGLNTGLIDYANRERNLLIETNTEFAIQIFREIGQAVAACDDQLEVEIRAEFSDEFGVDRPLVKSSVGRELMYAYDHAVHHLAMIKMGLRVAFPEVPVGEKIGVAPSTLKHWQQLPSNS